MCDRSLDCGDDTPFESYNLVVTHAVDYFAALDQAGSALVDEGYFATAAFTRQDLAALAQALESGEFSNLKLGESCNPITGQNNTEIAAERLEIEERLRRWEEQEAKKYGKGRSKNLPPTRRIKPSKK
jgi:hypothetical protein